MDANFRSQRNVCGCQHCIHRYMLGLEPLRFHSPEEIASLREKLTSRIATDYETLQLVWQKHGLYIVLKWKDMGQKKRLGVLERALPRRRPESELGKLSRFDSVTQRALCHPYMNAQDLAVGKNLLSLLKARAVSPPGRFALFDLQNANIPVAGHDNRADGHFTNSRMHLTADGSKRYGEIEDGSKPDGQSPFTVDIGIRVLQVQSDLYALLLKLVPLALGRKVDLSRSALEKLKNPKAGQDDISTDVDSTCSLQATLIQMPFCNPLDLDFDLVQDLATTKFDAAIQHVVHLRENPPYFLACMQSWADHLTENKSVSKLNTACCLMIKDAYQMVWLWNAVKTALGYLRRWAALDIIDKRVFQLLQNALEILTSGSRRYLIEGVPLVEPLKRHIEEVPKVCATEDDRITVYNYRTKSGCSNLIATLFSLLNSLCKPKCQALGWHNLTTQIDELLGRAVGAQKPMDNWLDERFSILLAVTQVQAHLQLWQKCVVVPPKIVAEEEVSKQKTEAYMYRLGDALYDYCSNNAFDNQRLRCSPEPSDDKATKSQQRSACEYLEKLWRGIDINLCWVSADGKFRRLLDSDGQPLSEAWALILDAVEHLTPLWQTEEPSKKQSEGPRAGDTQEEDKVPRDAGTPVSVVKRLHEVSIAGSGSSEVSALPPSTSRDHVLTQAISPQQERRSSSSSQRRRPNGRRSRRPRRLPGLSLAHRALHICEPEPRKSQTTARTGRKHVSASTSMLWTPSR